MFKECPAFLGMLLPVKFVSGLDSMHLYIATSCSTKNICMRAYKNTFIWSWLTVDLGYMFWVTTYFWIASVLMMNGFKKVNSWQHFNPGSLWFELPVLWSLSKNYTRRQSVLTILCMDTYYTKLFTPPFKVPTKCVFIYNRDKIFWSNTSYQSVYPYSEGPWSTACLFTTLLYADAPQMLCPIASLPTMLL